ncbi:ATP-binding cassette, subfamily F, uup [Allopseudospirillum japonicum]|uniref:ATP-binding protein Uup n=1 Tax=Allopseudospirillum japonicum TaxID=64971 RepID=A0A1H6SGD9_9GAMM|nr:ATP-binding cassette domain-containing protein [Allopseudospirillum japonicum]SEI64974.1 ATP-binding cassette, subfamily F, uup [Allopseudospirillum japonicum]
MTLVRLEKAHLAFGLHPLLDNVDLVIEKGERIGLIGRNGAGKSSLLKVMSGELILDSGQLWRHPSLRIGELTQHLPHADQQSVYDVIAAGIPEVGQLLQDYHHQVMAIHTEADLKRLEHLQHELEARDGWALGQKVDTLISKLGLPADTPMSALSGGWRRRVALARALVVDPDILLLDEPTNHLDIATIAWLEKQLLEFKGAILFITHDRTFMQALATRIIELDRGHLTLWEGSYQDFLTHKAHQLEVEARQNAVFDKKLAQEEAWIRQGIKARRTRNEGRVRALYALREQRQARRERQGQARLQLEKAASSGKLVAELTQVTHAYQAQGAPVIQNLDLTLVRGDRVALIGPNGVGKTTLLKIILGELTPNQGQVRLGTKLEVAYFDQLRDQLEPEKSVLDNLAQGRTSINVQGKEKHVISYLGDFLFSPERVHTPVKALSGGESNRLLLAKLFAQPANLLVLDEPTNDLDIDTLELLEELLINFQGSVLLVSHDRTFVDNVVTSTLVFDGHGGILEYVGGYSDWAEISGGHLTEPQAHPYAADQTSSATKATPEKPANTDTGGSPSKASKNKPKVKLSYKQQRELETLPEQIHALETALEQAQQTINQPEFYQQPSDQVNAELQALTDLQNELDTKLERWLELEALSTGA